MFRALAKLVRCWPACLLAVLILCASAGAGHAETVIFRNECRSPVTVCTSTVVRGVLRRDKVSTLNPGESTEKIKTDVTKVVTIYDAKSNRILFQESMRASKDPRYFGIVYNPRMPGRVQVVPRTKAAMSPKSP
jgi:hypothetical protein